MQREAFYEKGGSPESPGKAINPMVFQLISKNLKRNASKEVPDAGEQSPEAHLNRMNTQNSKASY